MEAVAAYLREELGIEPYRGVWCDHEWKQTFVHPKDAGGGALAVLRVAAGQASGSSARCGTSRRGGSRRGVVSARAELPLIRYDEGEFVATREVPFSAALDKLIAEVRQGNAPNLGRFCGYCATPLTPAAERCPTCTTETETVAPREKIPRPLAAVYTRKRKVEARIIHSAAGWGSRSARRSRSG